MSSLQRLIDHIEDLENHMQAFISENLQYVDINETLIQLTRLRIILEQEMKPEVEHD